MSSPAARRRSRPAARASPARRGATRILSSVPLSNARNSIVALSVSTSASRSSTRDRVALVLVPRREDALLHRGRQLRHLEDLGHGLSSDLLRARRGVVSAPHGRRPRGRAAACRPARACALYGIGHVERRHAQDGRVERVEREALHAVRDLGADAAVRPALVHDDACGASARRSRRACPRRAGGGERRSTTSAETPSFSSVGRRLERDVRHARVGDDRHVLARRATICALPSGDDVARRRGRRP